MHLCSGYGGFELALRCAGVDARTVCHVERDAYAAATLVARMEEQALDQAPIWDCLETFDGGPWRGLVDIVTAGFPCQPFSVAGHKRGLADDRWMWPHIARIVGDVRPGVVILENVPGVVRAGLADVLSDLADLGFNAEWGLLPASAVGAPHRRNRWWLVAHRQGIGRVSILGRRTRDGWSVPHAESPDVADAGCIGFETRSGPWGSEAQEPQPPSMRHHAWPPGPDDTPGWAGWIDAGCPQPTFRGGADGTPTGVERCEQLHLLGNGLVPQCAGEAIRQLSNRGSVTS